MLADRELFHAKIQYALVNFATMLEVAAYAAFRKTHKRPPDRQEHFNVDTYLGKGPKHNKDNILKKSPSFRDIEIEAFCLCKELMGARHEVLHNGEWLVREVDKNGEYTGSKRSLTGNDVERFRSPALAAIQWML